jgi:ankyrin repeat protein
VNDANCTARHFAAYAGREADVQLLIEHKVPVDTVEYRGASALVFAASQNRTPIVRALLRAGADSTLRTTETGGTALHYACKNLAWESALPLFELQTTSPDDLDFLGRTPRGWL